MKIVAVMNIAMVINPEQTKPKKCIREILDIEVLLILEEAKFLEIISTPWNEVVQFCQNNSNIFKIKNDN